MEMRKLMELAASGDEGAMVALGAACQAQGRLEEAVGWMERAASAGSPQAREWLDDWHYGDGPGTEAES